MYLFYLIDTMPDNKSAMILHLNKLLGFTFSSEKTSLNFRSEQASLSFSSE